MLYRLSYQGHWRLLVTSIIYTYIETKKLFYLCISLFKKFIWDSCGNLLFFDIMTRYHDGKKLLKYWGKLWPDNTGNARMCLWCKKLLTEVMRPFRKYNRHKWSVRCQQAFVAQTVRALASKSIGYEFESHHGLSFFLIKKTEACPALLPYVIIATVSSGLKRSVTRPECLPCLEGDWNMAYGRLWFLY